MTNITVKVEVESKENENIPWFSQTQFAHYWESYYKAQSWRLHQEIAYWKAKAVGSDFQIQQLEQLSRCPHLISTVTADEEEEDEAYDFQNTLSGEIEMEITDEMMEFLEKSARHKEERDRDNEKISEREAQERLDECKLPEDDSAIKEERLTKLYGEHAPTVNAMEMAIHVTFKRHCAIRQPKLWPNVPLRFPSTGQ